MKAYLLTPSTLILFLIISCSQQKTDTEQSDGAMEVLNKYFNSTTVEEKSRYVRFPGRVMPLMKEYYGETQIGRPHIVEIINRDSTKVMKIGDWKTIKVKTQQQEDYTYYVLQLTQSGYKLDWEASVEYNPMTFTAYNIEKPKYDVQFRTLAKLMVSDYDDAYAFQLFEIGTNNYFIGYALRSSMAGKSLYKYLVKSKTGEEVIVKVKYFKNRYRSSNADSDVHITDFVTGGFIELKDSIPN